MDNFYEVEVFIDVEPSRIWSALTDRVELGRWFGWDAGTLADEINTFFFEHAVPDAGRMRLDFPGMEDMYIEVAPLEAASVIRAVQPGDGQEFYAEIREGWIGFFHQLKRYIEDHPGQDRKTVYLSGTGVAAEVAPALAGRLPGRDWFSGEQTRVIATESFGPGLGVLLASGGLESTEGGKLTFTLSTWGLSEGELTELSADWLSWWSGLVEGAEVVT